MAIPKDWKDAPSTATPIDAVALEDLEERVLKEAEAKAKALGGITTTEANTLIAAYAVAKATQEASGMGVVHHGATAGTARPAGYKYVTWIGTVEPTNAIEYDIWINK